MRHQFSIQVHEKPPEIDIEEYMDDDDEDPEDDGFITGKYHIFLKYNLGSQLLDSRRKLWVSTHFLNTKYIVQDFYLPSVATRCLQSDFDEGVQFLVQKSI